MRNIDRLPQNHVMRKRFLRYYLQATPEKFQNGVNWYRNVRREVAWLARFYAMPMSTACGVVAALSPRAHWSTNMKWASKSLRTKVAVGGLKRNVATAQRIIDGEKPLEVLKGPKVRAFYRALMGYDDAVVDIWMARVAGVDSEGWTTNQYLKVATALREAADKVDSAVAEFQAVVWTVIRGKAD